MIQNLETRFSERRGSCFYSSAEERAESSMNFRALETRVHSTGASEGINESRR